MIGVRDATRNLGRASRTRLAVVVVVYVATAIAWFLAFPVKDHFKTIDVLTEGGYFLVAAVSYLIIVRLGQPLLEYAWPIFSYGLLIDFLDEFTLDKDFFNDPIEDIFNGFGLLLVALGFLHSYRRKMEELDRQTRSSRRLAEEKERLASTLRAIGEGVILADPDGRIEMANETACIMLGRVASGLEGRRLREVFCVRPREEDPGADCDLLARTLDDPLWLVNGRDFLLTPPNGRERTVELRGAVQEDADGAVAGVIFAFRDVTEKRLLEAEGLKAQRLRSLGILAGGVAHDFNNILSAILNWANAGQGMDAGGGDGESAFEPVFEGIRASCHRGKGLSAQLMGFARGGEPVKKAVDLKEFLRDETRFSCSGSSVQPAFSVAGDLWPVEADLGQIAQVVHNVVLNAVQAMPEGGRLGVRAGNAVLDDSATLPLPTGRYVCLEFHDQGPGIAEQDRERAFDPFFSTKEGGHGLGLALAFAIVQRHGGHMTIRSAVGQGSIVRIFLPATSSQPEAGRRVEGSRMPSPCRILIVDDDPAVLEPLKFALGGRGLAVESAGGGRQAVADYERAREGGHPFDFVLMDLTMPDDLGGLEATRMLRAADPACRCIATSGYHDDPVMAGWRQHGFAGVITKPFDVDELCTLLAELQETSWRDASSAS